MSSTPDDKPKATSEAASDFSEILKPDVAIDDALEDLGAKLSDWAEAMRKSEELLGSIDKDSSSEGEVDTWAEAGGAQPASLEVETALSHLQDQDDQGALSPAEAAAGSEAAQEKVVDAWEASYVAAETPTPKTAGRQAPAAASPRPDRPAQQGPARPQGASRQAANSGPGAVDHTEESWPELSGESSATPADSPPGEGESVGVGAHAPRPSGQGSAPPPASEKKVYAVPQVACDDDESSRELMASLDEALAARVRRLRRLDPSSSLEELVASAKAAAAEEPESGRKKGSWWRKG